MNLYEYGDRFFDYQQIGSLASARAVVPLVLEHLKPQSVLDMGCGAGAWVRAYREAGLADVVGVDAGYVGPAQLMFPPSRFRAIDITRPFSLGRRFDVVQCLEVAEHLPPDASTRLIDSLVAHAPVVLFSAAPPGQGGEHHVNEQPYEFWRDLFAQRGYRLFDFFRQRILYRALVEPWYRYNLMLFVHDDAITDLEPAVRRSRVEGRRVPDLAPLAWRVRRRIVALLPSRAVDVLAMAKHRAVLNRRSAARP